MGVYDIGFVSISEQLALGQFRGHTLHSQFRGSSVTIVFTTNRVDATTIHSSKYCQSLVKYSGNFVARSLSQLLGRNQLSPLRFGARYIESTMSRESAIPFWKVRGSRSPCERIDIHSCEWTNCLWAYSLQFAHMRNPWSG